MTDDISTRLTPGHGDEDADAVDRQHGQREQDRRPKLGDLADD
jgi:hypothetical protein